MKTPQI